VPALFRCWVCPSPAAVGEGRPRPALSPPDAGKLRPGEATFDLRLDGRVSTANPGETGENGETDENGENGRLFMGRFLRTNLSNSLKAKDH
jgi:hypothetical protein